MIRQLASAPVAVQSLHRAGLLISSLGSVNAASLQEFVSTKRREEGGEGLKASV